MMEISLMGENLSSGFPTMSGINWAVQQKNMAGGFMQKAGCLMLQLILTKHTYAVYCK